MLCIFHYCCHHYHHHYGTEYSNTQKDLYEVYGTRLNFLPESFDRATTVFRVTSNVITSQVAGGLISGMFGSSEAVPVLQQHSSIDSLRPGYGCAYADGVRAAYQGSDPGWTEHLEQSQALFDRLDAVSGVSPSDGGWHSWVFSLCPLVRSFGWVLYSRG